MKTKVVRIKESDYERMNLMKDYLNFMNFFTKLLDDVEQPKGNPELKKKKGTMPVQRRYLEKYGYIHAWLQRMQQHKAS